MTILVVVKESTNNIVEREITSKNNILMLKPLYDVETRSLHLVQSAHSASGSCGSYFGFFSRFFFRKNLVRENTSKRETHTQHKVRTRTSRNRGGASWLPHSTLNHPTPLPSLLLAFLASTCATTAEFEYSRYDG